MIYLTTTEILSIVRELGIQFEDKGKYIKFRCINQNHRDRNPSMTMLKNNGYCKCWSCGATYNFYAFVTKLSNGNYSKYIKSDEVLSRLFNQTLGQNQLIAEKKQLKKELRISGGRLYNPLSNSQVLTYLKKINVNKEMIDEFDIRYTNKAYISFSKENKKGTFIKDRICIPLLENGEIVNMECRDYTEEQKLKVIYPKGSKADILWNWDGISLRKPLYVVEGIKSAFRIWRYISKNVVATLGSSLGTGQKKLLSKVKNLILFPDNDDAGRSMITQINKFYDYDYLIVFMPGAGQDPADSTLEDLEYAVEHPIESAEWRLSQYDFYNKIKNKKITWEGVL